jgi:hypothetical protein
MKALRTLALKYPDCEEGVACKGTAVECSTFKVGGKAFLFLGRADLRVKLSDSLREAEKLAAKEPGRVTVGAHGWVKVTFSDDQPPPLDVLGLWIDESYQLMAGKTVAKAAPAKKKAPPRKPTTPIRKR